MSKIFASNNMQLLSELGLKHDVVSNGIAYDPEAYATAYMCPSYQCGGGYTATLYTRGGKPTRLATENGWNGHNLRKALSELFPSIEVIDSNWRGSERRMAELGLEI